MEHTCKENCNTGHCNMSLPDKLEKYFNEHTKIVIQLLIDVNNAGGTLEQAIELLKEHEKNKSASCGVEGNDESL